jgi:hypothetical protein
MINEIKKYIIILIAAFIAVNILGFALGFLIPILVHDLDLQSKIFEYGIPINNFIIRLVVSLIVRHDMIEKNKNINYLILILIFVDLYAGIGFYLLTRFFEENKPINILNNERED